MSEQVRLTGLLSEQNVLFLEDLSSIVLLLRGGTSPAKESKHCQRKSELTVLAKYRSLSSSGLGPGRVKVR